MEAINTLRFLTYRYCSQVKEYHVQQFIDKAPYLRNIDGTGAGEVSAAVAYGIMYHGRNLQKVTLMPKKTELHHWSKIYNSFKNRVIFGSCVVDQLAFGGDIKRMIRFLEQEL